MVRIPPALVHARFRWIWGGLFVSQVGSQMQHWALFWHISLLSKDPIAVSIVGGVRFGAVLLFSLVAGLAADRFNRRTIMFATQMIAMLIALVLGILTITEQIAIWHIYVLSAMQAATAAFDLPARQSMVPSLVPRADLPSAFSLQAISFNTGAIVGPAVSGLVIGYLGQEFVYFLNSISFLAVALALLAIGPVPQDVAAETARGLRSAVREIGNGITFIRRQPLILSSMVLDFFATLFASANTLLPYFSQNILRIGEVGYGWLAAAQSIGAVAVGLVISQLRGMRQQGALLLGAVAAFGIATMVFGMSRLYSVIFIALMVAGGADSISTIIRNTIRQLHTPDAMRGRMTGINQIFFMGGPQIGEVEAGVVAHLLGVPFAIVSGGAGTLLSAWLIARRWPVLRRYDREEPGRAGPTPG